LRERISAMENKQIIFTAPGIAELQDVALPTPREHEVLVKTAVSTVSAGTERSIVTGDPNVSIYSTSEEVHFPRQSGYSSSGTVVAVGSAVTSVGVGDRVAVYWGCHALYQCVDESRAVPLPDGVSLESAALCHIGCFPMAAIRKCRLELGESMLIMGLGVLGMLALREARAAGAVPIIAADPVPEKRAQALLYGADFALDPLAPDFAERVKEITGGGVNVAIEVTGVGSALETTLDCMKKFGRVSLLGCTRDRNFTIDYYRKVHGPGITLVGAHTNARPETESSPGLWTTRDDLLAMLRLLSGGRLELSSMIEETHSPENAPAVYARLAAEKFFPLVQFDWGRLQNT